MNLPNPTQFLLRPARLDDVTSIVALVATLTDSITSIPQDATSIEKRIHKSNRSFYPNVDVPGDEQYFFVLEGPDGIVGTAAIIARVGGYQPFYTFEISHEDFVHEPLGVAKQLQTLKLKASHDGPSEIGSLYLRPDCRRSGLGRLLSLGRFLFMARFPARFGQETLAELRGYLNEIGQSPFWESVGRPFFEREFTEADFLSGLGNKSFIRDLMPRHPLYTALLPTGAREVIGRVHNDTRPAKALLEAEGFASINEVDIFDAGPVLQAETSHLRSVRETRPYLISECGADAELPVKSFHAANGRLEFRACLARARVESPSSCVLSQSAAQLLGLSVGDTVYLVSARPDGV